MTANASSIAAGIAGSGTAGTALAWFAPVGTPLPVLASASLNVAFKDAGWILDTGLVASVAETQKDIQAFGTIVPVRTLITQSKRSFKLSFLETLSVVPWTIYNRLPLTGAGSITPTAVTGAMATTTGPPSAQRWAGVFDVVDGANALRAVCPLLQNTTINDLTISSGEPIDLPVELTAFPDSTGVAIYWYTINPSIG
jgi:hypothetical protein